MSRRVDPSRLSRGWRFLWFCARVVYTVAALAIATACFITSFRAHPDPEWIGLTAVGVLALLFAWIPALGVSP